MRALRLFVAAAMVTGSVFLVTGTASSQVSTQVSVGSAHLVAKGAQVDVQVTVVCDPSVNVAFVDATVSQVSGHKLAQGSGSFVNDFPGVPCTGSPQVVDITVPSFSSFAFKQGRATVNADFSTFDPVAFVLSTTTVGPLDVRITK
jgi:hypothetical protein